MKGVFIREGSFIREGAFIRIIFLGRSSCHTETISLFSAYICNHFAYGERGGEEIQYSSLQVYYSILIISIMKFKWLPFEVHKTLVI